jgi:outer membrane protein
MTVHTHLTTCLLLLTSLGGLMSPPARAAEDLLSVYTLALQADPVFSAAAATREAALEAVPQSRAVLLPNIGLSGNVSRDRFDPRNDEPTSYATNQNYSVQLRQSVYQRDRLVQREQADNQVAQAEAEFTTAQQELMLRVATAYFVVLGALDNLEFVSADKEAVGRTLDQATQRFEVGLTAITDVHEAQARYDIAVSELINAEKLLDDAREALREITGETHPEIEILQAEIPLVGPEPAEQGEWVETALDQNPALLAAMAATEAARNEVEVQRSGHYPSLDLTADYSYRDIRFGGEVDQERNDSSVGLELNLPLYQGGLVSSRTRQSRHRFSQAQEEQERQRRATERQTRDNYRGVITGISRVKALDQAVVSSETALEAAETGLEVGTRTTVDVLDAQRELLRARRDHARLRLPARYPAPQAGSGHSRRARPRGHQRAAARRLKCRSARGRD